MLLHTIHSIRPEAGGPSYSVPALCLALQEAGAEVELWTSEEESSPPTGLKVRCVGRAALESEFNLLRLKDRHLIVHDHGVWLPWNHAVARAAGKAGLPRVVSPRGMIEPWAMGYRAWKKWLAWWLYQRRDLQSASLLHATANTEADNFRKLGLRPPIIIAPNGVAVDAALPAGHDESKSIKTMLFLSRIHPKKGLLDLVKAWSKIRHRGWRIRIVGPDENGHRAEVQTAVRNAGLSDVVEFADHLSGLKKWEAYEAADLFVFPTQSENFGLVVAEALSAGLPVITTHGTPWSELKSTGSGWWIPTGPAALEDALREAIRLSASERRAMGEHGRKLITERYAWPSIARTMLEAYRQVGSGPIRRRS